MAARIPNWRLAEIRLPEDYRNSVMEAIYNDDLKIYSALMNAKEVQGASGSFKLWSLTFKTILQALEYKKDRSVMFKESLKICPQSLKSRDIPDKYGGRPIEYLAARFSTADPTVRELAAKYLDMMLDAGFDPASTAYNCCSPEFLSVLVKHGVDMNRINAYGQSPYFANLERLGKYKSSPEWLGNLLKYADPNLKISPITLSLLPGQEVPTIIAASGMNSLNVNAEIGGMPDDLPERHIRTLLDAGADPNAAVDIDCKRFVKGSTALHITRRPGIAKLLIKYGADVNKADAQGYTPLLRTVQQPAMNQEIFETLLDAGADLSVKTKIGDTLLHIAARTGNDIAVLPYLEDMIQAGLDINAQNDLGETCSHCLLSAPGRAETCRELVNHGVALDIQDNEGDTPLHGMSDSGMIETCLSMDADPNIRNKYGRTPLLEFFHRWGRDKDVLCGDLTKNVIKIYSKYGADLSAMDNNGKQLFDYILVKKYNKYIRKLVKYIEGQRNVDNEDIEMFVR